MEIKFQGNIPSISEKDFEVAFEISPKEALESAELLDIPVKQIVRGLLGLKANVEK